MLEYIRNEGIKQVILSASEFENLEEQVKQFSIINYFDKLTVEILAATWDIFKSRNEILVFEVKI
jgi:hypothetical protein